VDNLKGLIMTTDTTTELEIKATTIGTIDNGCDGSQQYILLTCLNDSLFEHEAYAWLMPKVYRDTNTPGGYFCHIVETIQKRDDQVICIVHHQFDN
jgi:hypothetical protein